MALPERGLASPVAGVSLVRVGAATRGESAGGWQGKSGSVGQGRGEGLAGSRVSFVRVHVVSSPGRTTRHEGASPGAPAPALGCQLVRPGPILTQRPGCSGDRHRSLTEPQ